MQKSSLDRWVVMIIRKRIKIKKINRMKTRSNSLIKRSIRSNNNNKMINSNKSKNKRLLNMEKESW